MPSYSSKQVSKVEISVLRANPDAGRAPVRRRSGAGQAPVGCRLGAGWAPVGCW